MKKQFLDAILAAGREGRSVALATDLASGRQLLLDRERSAGDLELDAAALAAVRRALAADRTMTLETAAGRVFVEVFSPPRRCFVVGAVHIAQPLVQMLTLAEYRAIVIDPRESFATAARFPGVELTHEWPDEALQRLKPDHRSAVVTLTHDPKLDDPSVFISARSARGGPMPRAAAALPRSGLAKPSWRASTARSGSRSARCRRPKSRLRSSRR
jgi:xanthine dehydrogenase accessory factor